MPRPCPITFATSCATPASLPLHCIHCIEICRPAYPQDEKATKASKDTAELIDKAPTAIEKLTANKNDISKLTMGEMKAIAYTRFNGEQLKGDKAAHVACMKKLLEAQPMVLNLVPTAPVAAVVALAAEVAPAAAGVASQALVAVGWFTED